MSNHQKRLSGPKSWPVERKTETVTVKADAGPHGEAGVPLLIVLRDVLGYVDSRKEARYALNEDNVRINGDIDSEVNRPGQVFTATLAEPLRVEGIEVVPAGADVRGRIVEVEGAGRVRGQARGVHPPVATVVFEYQFNSFRGHGFWFLL
jgi:small subunit ribosomal protein S4e